jgi:hypothetical protein
MHAAVRAGVRHLPLDVLAIALVAERLAQLLRGLFIDAIAFGAPLLEKVGVGGTPFVLDAQDVGLLGRRCIGERGQRLVGIGSAGLRGDTP